MKTLLVMQAGEVFCCLEALLFLSCFLKFVPRFLELLQRHPPVSTGLCNAVFGCCNWKHRLATDSEFFFALYAAFLFDLALHMENEVLCYHILSPEVGQGGPALLYFLRERGRVFEASLAHRISFNTNLLQDLKVMYKSSVSWLFVTCDVLQYCQGVLELVEQHRVIGRRAKSKVVLCVPTCCVLTFGCASSPGFSFQGRCKGDRRRWLALSLSIA